MSDEEDVLGNDEDEQSPGYRLTPEISQSSAYHFPERKARGAKSPEELFLDPEPLNQEVDPGFPVESLLKNIREADWIPHREELLNIVDKRLNEIAASGRDRYQKEHLEIKDREREEIASYNNSLETVLGNIIAAKHAPLYGPEGDVAFFLVSEPGFFEHYKEKCMKIALDPADQANMIKLSLLQYDLLRTEIYAILGGLPPKDGEFRPVKKKNPKESVSGVWTSDPTWAEAVTETPTNNSGITIIEVINKYEGDSEPYVRKIGLRYKKPNSASYDTSTGARTQQFGMGNLPVAPSPSSAPPSS